MKINLLSNKNEDVCITITGRAGKEELFWFNSILDHAWFEKKDVNYNALDRALVIRLRRHERTSKARTKFLGFIIWNNAIPPTKNCLLKINEIEDCKILDGELRLAQNQTVITGGVVFNEDEVYIGSFCQHENAFGITIKVKKLNFELEDTKKQDIVDKPL